VSGGITLGYVLIAVAFVDVIAVQMIARRMPGDTDDQRRAARIVTIASLATGLGLCLVALLTPIGQMRII
jgi:hypothetical protein